MKRFKHSLSHYKLFSCDMGELIPFGLIDTLPGDSFRHSASALVRCAPMVTPPMHPVHAKIHHFYVPLRLLWVDFEKFITGGPDGMDASVFPTITLPNVIVGSLADYLGIPLSATPVTVSALPFRAYAFIWNYYYRDQDLQTELVFSTASGPDTTTNTILQHAAWEKDYFTTARPWEQKGPAVTIPLGTDAPVVSNTNQPTFSGNLAVNQGLIQGNADAGKALNTATPTSTPGTFMTWGTQTGLKTDLTNASAITINLLRQATSIQRFEEHRARFGSRYTEYLRFLGIRASDARLQRPEYLAGGKQTIQFSEVLQTSPTSGDNLLAQMAGHGVAAMRSNRYVRFFEEHGFVISLMNVMPRTIYMQGLSVLWNRRTKDEFWQKEFQHIGQKKVKNKEVYIGHTSPEGTFGYQDRYDEYRRMESGVSGEFRTTLLNDWHFARDFSSDPALNASFVKGVPPERPFAAPSQDVLYIMAQHSLQARRLVSPQGNSFLM